MWHPSFIGGFRSGTTLLVNLLGLHRELAPWFETKGVCEALRWQRALSGYSATECEQIGAERIQGASADAIAALIAKDFAATAERLRLDAPSGKASYERYPIGFDCARYSVQEAGRAVESWRASAARCPDAEGVARATGGMITRLGSIHAERSGKNNWINKTPEITRFSKELDEALGPCRFILLIRNPLDVVASAKHLGWASVGELATWWKCLVELSREASARAPERYLEVRFEDLTENTEVCLNRILRFLDLAEHGASLVATYGSSMARQAPQATGGRRPELTARERAEVYQLAGKLMEELRYR